MNATEKIQAAIDKLEQLKEAAFSAGDWSLGPSQGFAARSIACGETWVGTIGAKSDAQLIVTLHRTIDGQLAVLRAGLTASSAFPQVKDDNDLPGWAAEAKGLALPLADAILGGDL